MTLPPGFSDYASIVDAIISCEYPERSMQAVVNNYLLETNTEVLINQLVSAKNFNKLTESMNQWIATRDPAIIEAYNTMQDWRSMAKEVAKQVINQMDTTPFQ